MAEIASRGRIAGVHTTIAKSLPRSLHTCTWLEMMLRKYAADVVPEGVCLGCGSGLQGHCFRADLLRGPFEGILTLQCAVCQKRRSSIAKMQHLLVALFSGLRPTCVTSFQLDIWGRDKETLHLLQFAKGATGSDDGNDLVTVRIWPSHSCSLKIQGNLCNFFMRQRCHESETK